MSIVCHDHTSTIAEIYPLVIIPCGSKGPKTAAWQNKWPSPSEVQAALRRGKNIGLILGPKSGVLDLEVDGPEGEASRRKLFGGEPPVTPRWQSLRGRHDLFKYDNRLAMLGASFKHRDYPGLEFRIGGASAQSIIPPSTVDGFRREWEVSLVDHDPSELPEEVVQKIILLKTGERSAEHMQNRSDALDCLGDDLRDSKMAKLAAYFKKHGIEHSVESIGGICRIRFENCPLRGSAHRDGGAVVFVNADGSHWFDCKHAKCVGKTFVDVEKQFGPLATTITLGPDLDRVVKQSIGVLAENPGVFQNGVLVQVVREATQPPLCLHDNGAPRLRQIPVPSLGPILAGCAVWRRWNASSRAYVRCAPPADIIRAVDAAPEFAGVPVVTGIVSSPVLRADGSVLCKSGYDRETGLYLDIDGDFPSLMDPREAIALLHDVTCDFPFLDHAHRSAWVASLITLLARPAFAGPAPMFMFEANASRTGKGLLTDVSTMISEGRKAARHSPPRNDEEFRKVITSVALSGKPYVIFDNIKNKFGGEAIENAMTAGRWSDRLLGGNKTIDVPLNLVWFATANNATVTQDMVGRLCLCRLETKLDNPALRCGFRHQSLLSFVKTHRRKLAVAAISIPAAYMIAGMPEQNLPSWGGFEGWSHLVRGSLVWAGETDPAETRRVLAEHADDESATHRRLVAGWAEIGLPVTVSGALEFLDNSDPLAYSTLRDVVAELKGDRGNALGQLLKKYRRRVVNRQYFDKNKEDSPKWQLFDA